MNLNEIANRVLNAVSKAACETRYEEKPWTDAGIRIAGTNEVLRDALNGVHKDGCDIVFDHDRVWMEVKHSWTWFTYRNPSGANKSYQKHLFSETDNSAYRDAASKLPALCGRPGIEVVGLLVIALDSDSLRHPRADIDLLQQKAGMNQPPWQHFSLPRWKSQERGYSSIGIQPFLWLRPAK